MHIQCLLVSYSTIKLEKGNTCVHTHAARQGETQAGARNPTCLGMTDNITHTHSAHTCAHTLTYIFPHYSMVCLCREALGSRKEHTTYIYFQYIYFQYIYWKNIYLQPQAGLPTLKQAPSRTVLGCAAKPWRALTPSK